MDTDAQGTQTDLQSLSSDPAALTQALVRCASVTPAEGGAIALLERLARAAGADVIERLPFGGVDGRPQIENLFVRFGTGTPHICFAGHTDVVPPGDTAAWTRPPFSGALADGYIHGRGSVDMKSGVACFVTAALDWARQRSAHVEAGAAAADGGSVSLLITGDEEGPAVDGTQPVLDWMAANGHTPTCCIVGEPTSIATLGDEIKIGRRGSLTGRLTVHGRQGHVAYQHAAHNPIPDLAAILLALNAPLDDGSAHFPPSNLEVTNVAVDNEATNVIPARAQATFNVRHNDHHTRERLEALLRARVEDALSAQPPGAGILPDGEPRYELSFSSNANVFLTAPGPLTDLVCDAIATVTGQRPALVTSGGTSDARFVTHHCPVVECGLLNAGMHAIDEKVAIGNLAPLTQIYRGIIDRALADGC